MALVSDLADTREFLAIAAEALSRYKLRTFLSVLGVMLGVAAVIAMMSVSDGAREDALSQVQALGLENLIVRNHSASAFGGSPHGITAGDAEHVQTLVPLVAFASPLVERFVRISYAEKSLTGRVLGVRPRYQDIVRLEIDRGRLLTPVDDKAALAVCVLGATLARQLFAYLPPVDQYVRIGSDHYRVVGVLREQSSAPGSGGTLAWRNLNDVALVPMPALTGRSIDVSPGQPVDEIWVRVQEGDRVEQVAASLDRALVRLHGTHDDFDTIVPRELLAQRIRTQRTFSVLIGSVAALALLVGGIGIMNIMLTSVVERTQEIGVRRTVGATRRDVTVQFLIEAILMTGGGGVIGIAIGAAVSGGITAYAGWRTQVSPFAIVLAFFVSVVVGLVFGLYPAIKAARLEPVDAVRYE